MRLIQRFILALMLFCTTQKTYSQLQIVPQTNAQALAQKLVGGGVTISNVTLTGSSLSTAFFYNQGGTQLAMDSGIVLSTGRVLSAPGLPGLNGSASQLANSQTNTPGD